MPPRTQWTPKERDTRSQLTRLLHQRSLLAGSLVTMARRCGKPKCRCRQGHKHVSLYLSVRLGQTRRMIYVPPKLEPMVREAVEAYRQARQLTQEVCGTCLQRFLKAKRQLAESRRATAAGQGTPRA